MLKMEYSNEECMVSGKLDLPKINVVLLSLKLKRSICSNRPVSTLFLLKLILNVAAYSYIAN